MFGGMRAVAGPDAGTVITRFRTKRAALLLAYLALDPSRDRSRDELCEMLWPEEDPDRQRTRLRYELSTLRGMLGAEAILTRGTTLVCAGDALNSDVAQFKSSVRMAQRARSAGTRLEPLRKAFTLYRGDILPGFHLPEGCLPENDWVSLERTHLRECYRSVAEQLISALRQLGLRAELALVREEFARQFPEADEGSILPASLADTYYEEDIAQNRVSFFGRKSEMDEILSWALDREGAKILTLTGMGGIGKSRLAAEAVAGKVPCVVVPLVGISDGTKLYEAVHAALGLPFLPTIPIARHVFEAVQGRGDFFIILDNFEHILSSGAPLVVRMLTECPNLRCLITSRRSLGVDGERIMDIAPLQDQPSLQLFLYAARHARPGFAASPDSLQAVRDAVGLLEGIPLALHIAAAARWYWSAQIRDQLRERLRFLKRSVPCRPPA
jgi:hypothetical protein